MQHDPKPNQRAVGSVVALALLFVAAPLSLIRVGRFRFGSANPLADIGAPWTWNAEQVRAAVSAPLSNDAVVNALIRGSLLVIWVALAIVALSIVIEAAHMVRHRGIASPRVRGIGWAQHVGRWVATGLIGLLPVASLSSASLALSTPTPGVATTLLAGPRTAAASPGPALTSSAQQLAAAQNVAPLADAERAHADRIATASDNALMHTVVRGESVFSIAASLAGADERRTLELADVILDLNLGTEMLDGQRFTNPALIQPGWQLRMPTTNLSPHTAPAPAPAPRAGEPAPIHHVVSPGETLSGIAEQHLGSADEWPAVWAANRGTEMPDGQTFDDPNLILTGWKIEVPRAASEPETSEPETSEPETSEAETSEPDNIEPNTKAPVEAPASDAANDVADDAANDIATDVDVERDSPTRLEPDFIPQPERSPTTTTTSTIPPTQPAADPATSRGGAAPAPDSPSPIRLEHGALLAAGILALVGVRRRRSLRSALPHARLPTPPPEVAATERRLRALDAGERAARIDVATRAIAHQLISARSTAQIGTVRAAPDGELVIRLTAAAMLDLPLVGGPQPNQTWTLPASVPIEMLSDDARQVGQPCLSLVTIGLDDDERDVLIELEAAGVTTIEAAADQGDDVVRAIGSGLATSLASEVTHLVVASLGAECLFDHPNGKVLGTVEASIEAALALAGSTATSERTSFDLRSRRTGGEMWEPAIMLFASGDNAANQIDSHLLPAPGHGIAIVTVTDPSEVTDPVAGARLRASSHGWTLDAFGESFSVRPIGMLESDVSEVAAVLVHAELATDPEIPSPHDITGTDTGELVDVDQTRHEIVVRLMGGVDVVDRSGNPGVFERSKTVELIAWLATHRERATRTGARTALWELDVRDATFANVVSEARRGLGRLVAPPAEAEWLARTLNESLPLHEYVVTDVELIRERLEHARVAAPAHAIEILRPAAAMIRDMPFAGTSYLWPDADGLTSNLVLLATTVTSELAGHALSIGDTDLVFWATGQGLNVLPGHEELIGLRMRAHARAGDLAGVRQEWESYERVIMADSWSDGEPAPKLLDLRRELLSPT